MTSPAATERLSDLRNRVDHLSSGTIATARNRRPAATANPKWKSSELEPHACYRCEIRQVLRVQSYFEADLMCREASRKGTVDAGGILSYIDCAVAEDIAASRLSPG